MSDFLSRKELQELLPQTTAALTWLVPAMEAAYRNDGKKSLFGKDKGKAAYEKMLTHLETAVFAMFEDRLVESSMPLETLHGQLLSVMTHFAAAYPNWPDAYRYGDWFISPGTHPDLLRTIESARQIRLSFEAPMVTRGRIDLMTAAKSGTK